MATAVSQHNSVHATFLVRAELQLAEKSQRALPDRKVGRQAAEFSRPSGWNSTNLAVEDCRNVAGWFQAATKVVCTETCYETAVAPMYKRRWNHNAVKGKAALLLDRLISWPFFLNFLELHVVTRPAIDVEKCSVRLAFGSSSCVQTNRAWAAS